MLDKKRRAQGKNWRQRMLFVFLFLIVIFVFTQIGLRLVLKGAETVVLEQDASGASRILFVGDTGTGSTEQKQVAELMERLCRSTPLDAVFHLGDVFYPKGVKDRSDAQFKLHFDDIYGKECLSRIPFFIVLGNHDYKGSVRSLIRHRSAKTKWTLPGRYYTVKVGDAVQFYLADTNYPDRCGIPFLCSLDWLIQAVDRSQASWNYVLGHHPMVSGGKYPQAKAHIRFLMDPLLCHEKVNAYISGHDHNLQHLRYFSSSQDCETSQWISGAGGATMYPAKLVPGVTRFEKTEHGVLVGEFSQRKSTLTFYSVTRTNPEYFYEQVK